MTAETAVATAGEYRAVLSAGRRTVELLESVPIDEAATAEPESAWFERQRAWAVERWNRTHEALAHPDPDLVYLNLGELRGLARAMMENCDWERLAPDAAQAHGRFVKLLDAVWAKLAETGTPGGDQVSGFFPQLAVELPPL